MSRDPYLDEMDRQDMLADAANERAERRSGACQCFAPGEAGGTCPGPQNCPMCEGDDEIDSFLHLRAMQRAFSTTPERDPMKKTLLQLRQGDVQIQQVAALPAGCTELAPEGNRIVLAHGEVTGHAHAIYDHLVKPAQRRPGAADEIAEAAIARAQAKARLLVAPSGERYLEVTETVTLKHEEHSAHTIPPGIYHLPRQMEYTPAELQRVAD